MAETSLAAISPSPVRQHRGLRPRHGRHRSCPGDCLHVGTRHSSGQEHVSVGLLMGSWKRSPCSERSTWGQGAFSLHIMLAGSGAGNCHPENVREVTTEEEADGHAEMWSQIKICHLVSHPTLDSRRDWIAHFHILWPLRVEFPVICSPDHLNWYTWRDPGCLGMLSVTGSNYNCLTPQPEFLEAPQQPY